MSAACVWGRVTTTSTNSRTQRVGRRHGVITVATNCFAAAERSRARPETEPSRRMRHRRTPQAKKAGGASQRCHAAPVTPGRRVLQRQQFATTSVCGTAMRQENAARRTQQQKNALNRRLLHARTARQWSASLRCDDNGCKRTQRHGTEKPAQYNVFVLGARRYAARTSR